MAMKVAGYIEKHIYINNYQTICDIVCIIRSLEKVRARKKATGRCQGIPLWGKSKRMTSFSKYIPKPLSRRIVI